MKKKFKIIIVGPKNSGKTSIANFLADSSKAELGNKQKSYQPTSGCRILEFETGSDKQTHQIELWDVSGDLQYEHCWPAIMQGIPSSDSNFATEGQSISPESYENVDGVMLVYNCDHASQETQIGLWYDHFVRKTGLESKENSCMVLIHTKEPKVSFRNIPPKDLKDCKRLKYTTFETGNEIRAHFEEWMNNLTAIYSTE